MTETKRTRGEAYITGYAAGAATVLRKVRWPEAPKENTGHWLDGFENGQEAALRTLEMCKEAYEGHANGLTYEAALDLPEWLQITGIFRMAKEYVDG